MNKKLVYGGMMTAMSLVLATGVMMQTYTPEKPLLSQISGGPDIIEAPGGDISKAYEDALVETNIQRTEPAIREGTSANPAPAKESSSTDPMLQETFSPRNEKALRTDRHHELQKKYKADAQVANKPAASPELNLSTTEAEADASFYAGAPAEAKRERRAVAGAAGNVWIAPQDEMPTNYYKDEGRDQFTDFEENQIKVVSAEPVSTFSIDVDTTSYSFMRRQINAGVLPQKDAVRIEELINYFDYDYKKPETKEQPFASSVTVTPSPWKEGNKLVHIGIRGYDIAPQETPRSNLVFLLDTSGSMDSPDKLPLLINSMKLLLDTLQPDDTVGIVVYAGSAGTVLEPTKVAEKSKILKALENLSAGGSTAGAEGIRQAYQLAEANFNKEAVNRVILATDGDFNVGITDPEELQDFVERKRETGIFLSVLGFGEGNYNDHLMQELAQNGNGAAAYIDTLNEARKVLVEEAQSTLFPIAKDVKIQVEFNPANVAEYRLVGYETRHLNREDFNNDAVDAGDIGAGHTVTAIYEITPVGGPRAVDDSRYSPAAPVQSETGTSMGNELAFLKIRYKLPAEDASKLITTPITAGEETKTPGTETNWATAVASFGQLLKGGKYAGTMTYDDVIKLAQENKGKDEFGYRAEFINLVRLAKSAGALEGRD